jgi:hypothetical protein
LIILLLQDHPNDAYMLNKPIEQYKEIMVIFGNGQATGKWAMGSNEALGTPSDCAESSLKIEATEILNSGKTDTCDTTKAEIAVGRKRKRSLLGEEDVVVLSGMSEAVKEVASAIRSTRVEDC